MAFLSQIKEEVVVISGGFFDFLQLGTRFDLKSPLKTSWCCILVSEQSWIESRPSFVLFDTLGGEAAVRSFLLLLYDFPYDVII